MLIDCVRLFILYEEKLPESPQSKICQIDAILLSLQRQGTRSIIKFIPLSLTAINENRTDHFVSHLTVVSVPHELHLKDGEHSLDWF